MNRVPAFITWALLGASALAASPEIPAIPKARVNDLVGILSPGETHQIELLLETYERESSCQLALLVIDSLEGDTVENVAVRTFKNWGLGTKANNNGVLLLVAIQERQMRIETGYGLEGRLTDAISDSIIRNNIRPAFREQRYFDGIRSGFEQILAATRGEYTAPQTARRGSRSSPGSAIGFLALVILLMLIGGVGSLFSAATGRTRRRRGYWTAGSGGFSSGLWLGGGGGSSSGGGGGSSWGGGGGFSGFSGGGGLSGGGGASGSW